ncbi:AbrB family transcriptional regulator [Bacillus sp. ISL-39]|uniref:AbrB family transcriptional regulator n=1 Tax=Bacillus sp. ISL-39 TaxID=2819124 RepID=UPI001BEB2920|nr:AbrB family transcriptional regulator [Bacillus sp. ISL-39]MBT2638360.1 AbrB family transcriptional regulator [Bacillus sp. ISL-39]
MVLPHFGVSIYLEGAALIKSLRNHSFITAFLIALVGGLVFSFLSIPVPWLLGPMSAILIANRFKGITLYWPRALRDTALILIGYSIGLSFTRSSVENMAENLPAMLFMTVILVASAALISKVISLVSGVDYPTVLTGSIPGGLSQMIVFAEEMKGIDITTVTFLQVSRLLMIVFVVPFIIFGPVFNISLTNTEVSGSAQFDFEPLMPVVFLIVSILGVLIGKKFRLPTPFLLGPILGTGFLTYAGFTGPTLPSSVMDSSQLMIGGYIGMLLKPEKLERKSLTISLALFSGFLLVMESLLLSFFLSDALNINIVTSFLSLAPGGMDQMGIIAHEVNADLSIVSGFQLFRLFFIYFAVPPILRWYFKRNIN